MFVSSIGGEWTIWLVVAPLLAAVLAFLLPRAAVLLAQGAGRLIRSVDDRGLVAVLDPRLATKSYGSSLVRALPDMARTADPEIAREFVRRMRAR